MKDYRSTDATVLKVKDAKAIVLNGGRMSVGTDTAASISITAVLSAAVASIIAGSSQFPRCFRRSITTQFAIPTHTRSFLCERPCPIIYGRSGSDPLLFSVGSTKN